MSNELSVILQSNPSLIQTGLDADTLAVAGNSVNESKRISIKGGVFRKMSGGKEVGAIEDRHMNVIIIKMAHTASRTFYQSTYKEGEKVVPTCWSSDSRVPDADVKNPPAPSCDVCPNSVKNSAAANGAQCRLSWRTAVVLPNDPAGDIMQLVLPSTSCWQKEENGKWGFRPYIQMLANNNVSARKLITRMQFDTKSPTPKVLFSPAGAVPPEDIAIIEKQASSPIAEAAVKLTVYQPKEDVEVAAPEVQTAAPVAQAAQPQSDVVAEPILRETPQADTKPVSAVKDIMNKWAVKN